MIGAVRPRSRLFRKYAMLFAGVVSGVLLLSALVELYFSYREILAGLEALQREQALGAASRIELFINEIERQVGWAGQSQGGLRQTVEERRFEYLRLLRQVPAVTEIAQLDAAGREQLRVSRLAMDVVGSQADFSQRPEFTEAKRDRPYYGPVYFRKESEPYLTLALAGGGDAGVTIAEVNLKLIWDVVSRIRIGEAGQAFVVDSGGQLVAHPDISLVLQKKDLSRLVPVAAALARPPGGPSPGAIVARGLGGRQVLTTAARVSPLGWWVFVEQPLAEAFQPLYASVARTVGLLLVGVGVAVLASLLLARRIATPIQALEAGAARIGAGALDHHIDVRTGDELEALAGQFNRMASRLRESYATLEQKVEDRTRQLEERNQQVTEALEQQTATAEILHVISSSPTDLEPVFNTILVKACTLADAALGAVFRLDGDTFESAASIGVRPEFAELLRTRRFQVGRPMYRPHGPWRPVHIADVTATEVMQDPLLVEIVRMEGVRTVLGVPLVRQGRMVGSIMMYRREVRPFTDKQIDLVSTFATQTVIAIQNVRLFQELQARTRELARSVEQLQALGAVGQAVSSTLDLETVLTTVASRADMLAGADGGAIYEHDEATRTLQLRATQRFDEALAEVARATPVPLGEGAVGRAAASRQPVEIVDIDDPGAYESGFRGALRESGIRAVLAVPLVREGRVLGALVVVRKSPGGFGAEVVGLLKTLAAQSAIAIQNARLFRELEAKSLELEAASRHKSEFLANMSHELRTPLNAIIGFSEVLGERMFGELNAKQAEYIEDIRSSGRHLLALINDILDLSKVEAGRMELELSRFDLPSTVGSAVILVRERATRHGLTLEVSVDDRVGPFVGDERKIRQVLLNLLSNAVKFTSEGGRIAVRVAPASGPAGRPGKAGSDDQGEGAVEISVTDTGIGIAATDQEAIFEAFQQVGTDYARKREGTGLGLALAKRFVELHGGRIWVKSQPGEGSTFTFSLPVRPWPAS